MEAATFTDRAATARRSGGSPLLKLQADERLVAMTRRGDQAAFEVLVSRYQSRLLGFCRNMLGSREDAEDVLQEVFAAAYTAMLADNRPIMVKPWLYRIARNRSLNHMRRARPVGVDSMDIHVSEFGMSTADRVHRKDEFLGIMQDIAVLPETQRTALMLREMDGLSYDQIADVMETTVPSVKSLLVRARVALAEMSEARGLTCEDVRLELGEVAEGLTRRITPPVKRHLKSCDRCKEFKSRLTATDVAVAAMAPVGLLVAIKNLVVGQLGLSSGSASAGSAAGAAASGSAVGAAGGGIGGAISAGAGAVASKAAAGLAAAALVTTGVVQVENNITPPAPATAAAEAQAPAHAIAHRSTAADKTAATAPATTVEAASVAPTASVEPIAQPVGTVTTEATAPTDATPVAPSDVNSGSTVVIDEAIELPPTDSSTPVDTAGSGPTLTTPDESITPEVSGDAAAAAPSVEAPVTQ
ncbi:MAG: RNA polymerase sigma factor [Actinomycetes bacterium]